MTNAVIVGYARSPFTPARKGALAKVRPDDLAAQVLIPMPSKTLFWAAPFPKGNKG